ncbi:hypothetical protein [Hyphomicrobium sp.]|uniref:hypothetical protein n=1 Tax=Hyphomicrobium sp. TaxID=82 RepID=UPI001D2B511F|nr:hypothetical protein [Hyphomicrobium sp.]MBY0562464.1 hypothetical protein [Hyphomicrobium sp.]
MVGPLKDFIAEGLIRPLPIDAEGEELWECLGRTIDDFWEKRNYNGADGLQTMIALVRHLAQLLAGMPEEARVRVQALVLADICDMTEAFLPFAAPAVVIDDRDGEPMDGSGMKKKTN